MQYALMSGLFLSFIIFVLAFSFAFSLWFRLWLDLLLEYLLWPLPFLDELDGLFLGWFHEGFKTLIEESS